MNPHSKEQTPPYLVHIDASGDDAREFPVDPVLLAKEGVTLEHVRGNRYVLHRDGKTHSIVIEDAGRGTIRLTTAHRTVETSVLDHRDQLLAQLGIGGADETKDREVRSPMPGLVLKLNISVGDRITKGQALVVLEAMKMENDIKAGSDGTITAISVADGDAVQKDQVLLELDPDIA